jgi:hypothetical protein
MKKIKNIFDFYQSFKTSAGYFSKVGRLIDEDIKELVEKSIRHKILSLHWIEMYIIDEIVRNIKGEER